MFLQKVTLQIGLKKYLRLKKLKADICRGHILLLILMGNKLLEHVLKNSHKKQIKKS